GRAGAAARTWVRDVPRRFRGGRPRSSTILRVKRRAGRARRDGHDPEVARRGGNSRLPLPPSPVRAGQANVAKRMGLRRCAMKLGILKTGGPPRALAKHGSYPEMFRKLLGEERCDYAVFDAEQGELPAEPSACGAYLITGSACDAYAALPWIVELKRFLVAAMRKAARVAICAGSQVMAAAIGGRVIMSPSGWGLGNHRSEVVQPQPWMDGATTVTLPASHQDQVVELPEGAEVVAGSAFSPPGMIVYTDQPALSLQLHPEFGPGA